MYEDFIAERITTLRERKGVSAREMSLAIGQNESYINRIENKKAFPSMQVFFYICEYLGITPKEFFDTATLEPQKINKLIDNLNKLTTKQLEAISVIVEELL